MNLMAIQRKSLKILIVLFAGLFTACIDSRPPTMTKVMDGPIELPARQGFINDYAGVVDDATKQKLEAELLAFKERTNVDFVIVIVDSKDGYSIEDHSMAIAKQWCLACRADSSGEILLDISMQEGEFRCNVSAPLWSVLPEEDIARLSSSLEQSFARDEYSDGLSEIVHSVVNRVLTHHKEADSNA